MKTNLSILHNSGALFDGEWEWVTDEREFVILFIRKLPRAV
jgi:hypothetical protein